MGKREIHPNDCQHQRWGASVPDAPPPRLKAVECAEPSLGRVLHFHSFRKTIQSLGVRYGINQRAAQEILGHSDANLTAKAYMDVASLQLYREIAKLPWISPAGIGAQYGAQKPGVSGPVVSLADILRQLQQLAQATGTDGVSHALTSPGTSCQTIEMAAQAGIEPATK